MSFPNTVVTLFRHLKFDHHVYRDHHADLNGLSAAQLYRHFLLYGWRENRIFNTAQALRTLAERHGPLPDDFSGSGYIAANPDLAHLFEQESEFELHYLQFGRAEGRGYVDAEGTFRCEDSERKPFLQTHELVKPDGIVPARRPINEYDFALAAPFGFTPAQRERNIAVVIHCFYPEVLPLLLEKLHLLPCDADLFLSTNTQEKKAAIENICAHWRGGVEVRIFPNRGRDVAPKIFGFADVYARYDIFLHLHTKKSPHGGDVLASWRDYLIDTLIGSRDIISSILSLFDDPKTGVVFPQHMFEIRGGLNWGYNYDIARALLKKVGIALNKNLPLEFPSGSMFWGRSAALRPLLDLNLSFEDFPVETGQIDGTLAHAIERTILMFAELSGHEWLKVARRDLYPLQHTLLEVTSPDDIPKARLKVFRPCLCGEDASTRPTALAIRETHPLLSYPSRNSRPRLNLLAPSVHPGNMFFDRALSVFSRIADSLGSDCDRRIVATDAKIEENVLASLSDYARAPYAPTFDETPCSLVDAHARGDSLGQLDLRENDIFLATDWRTADFAERLEADRARIFGKGLPVVFLIQDDQADFCGSRSRSAPSAAASSTGTSVRAIIDSEELYATIQNKHRFKSACCIPYRLNHDLASRLTPQPRQRIMLVCARPSVARDAFEMICGALSLWQQQDPVRASRWRIVFTGERFNPEWAEPVQNFEFAGALSRDDYATLLGAASVGLSIMLTPHSTYALFEMIEAGLVAIINDDVETMRVNPNPSVNSLAQLNCGSLARAIEDAVARGEQMIGRVTPRGRVARLALRRAATFDADDMARLLREDLADGKRLTPAPKRFWRRPYRQAPN
ncbi:MAG: rhamnan synthesis F family protein [Methylocystis sp.]|uniref:rhamnosyltransferase WsaF family glycosyltransferase n=1 Tax=Methylocystis sp. TaxID=1911079 RepID=UPI003D125D6E